MPGSEWEGWFTDPFGRHEARWLSKGKPTKLVRDGSVESYDDPPEETPSHVPEQDSGENEDTLADLYRVEDAWGPKTQLPILGAPRVFDERQPLHVTHSRVGAVFGKLPLIVKTVVIIVAIAALLFLVFLLADHLMHTQNA